MDYFRLIAGDHISNNESGEERLYRQGELVPSTKDLEARWPEKFRRASPGEIHTLKAAQQGFGEGHSSAPQDAQTTPPLTPFQTGPGGSNDPNNPTNLLQHGAQPASHAGKGPKDIHENITEEDLKVFDTMTDEELRQYAKEEEINLKGAKTKQAMVTEIRRTLKGGK